MLEILIFDVLEVPWHLRHDDEIWTNGEVYCGSGASPDVTKHIIHLHNQSLEKST